jgi:hypothetical protein
LISPPQRGPADTVRALSGLRAGGQRSTSDALTMAKDQFPDSPAGNRVVVFYTSAVDAGGESSSALGTRFLQAATILIVVGGAGDSPYWSDAAPRTGGFFAPAGTSVVAPALDQMARTLRHRYLVQFPTPQTLPARVSVRIDTGKLVLAGDAVIPAENRGRPGPASRFRGEVALVTIAGCLVVFLAVVLMVRRRPVRLGGVHRARSLGAEFFHRLGGALSIKPVGEFSHRLGGALSRRPGGELWHRLGGVFSLKPVGELSHRLGAAISHRPGAELWHRLGGALSRRPAELWHRLGGAVSRRPGANLFHRLGGAFPHGLHRAPSHRLGRVRSGDMNREASTVVRERAPLPAAAVRGHASVPGAVVPRGAVDDTVARGRAAVPGAVAQGRAHVPGTGQPPSFGQRLTDGP